VRVVPPSEDEHVARYDVMAFPPSAGAENVTEAANSVTEPVTFCGAPGIV
jgi:acetoacetate decarboxylase